MTIDNRVVLALLDPGSDINLIDKKLVNQQAHFEENILLRLAIKNQSVYTEGSTDVVFYIKNVNFKETFQVVSGLGHQIILGMPFFSEHNVVLDFERECMNFGKETRATVFWRKNQLVQKDSIKLPEIVDPEFSTLVKEFEDVFLVGLNQPTTRTTTHHIHLKNNIVINKRCYPMAPMKKEILYKQIDEMLKAGVIEPSISQYASPPVLVMRTGKKPRFCVDYRELNKITLDESSGLPRISDALKNISEARIFTVLDLKSGYWQVPLEPTDKHKTAFTTPDGTAYQFTVMPFGLKNAPATFQRLMAGEVLVGYVNRFTQVYLDDVIIYSNSKKEHLYHLRLILERLRLHGLRASAEKCHIGMDNLDYLGFRIEGDSVVPQQKHLKQIADFRIPKNRKQLQAFLGTCGWLREHIPRYSDITAPLTEMLKGKSTKLVWTEAEDAAFEMTKQAVAKAQSLNRPDFSKQFILQTDASQEGMAAVLFQEPEAGRKNIISFASAKFKPNERRLHVNEQECLALVWAINHFRHYLEDSPFIVRTDSKCLTWLEKFKDTKAKLTRWALQLQEYSFTLEHVRGSENYLPDLLSRRPDDIDYQGEPDNDRLVPPGGENPDQNLMDNGVTIETELANLDADALFDKVAREQANVNYMVEMIATISALKETNDILTPEQEQLLRKFAVDNGLLWRRHSEGDRLVVPRKLVTQVIEAYHDTEYFAHPGTAETSRRISKHYFWGYMFRDVGRYIANCIVCGLAKTVQRQDAAPQKPRIPKFPWEMISVDVLGPYPEASGTKNKYIILVEDVFSRWLEAFTFKRVTASDVVNVLEREIYSRYGVAHFLISDNGRVFTSKCLSRSCNKYRVTHLYSAIYHQRANPVERRVQELKKVLRVLLLDSPEANWEKKLPLALQVLRGRRNAATGETPSAIVLGYELPLPGEWQSQ